MTNLRACDLDLDLAQYAVAVGPSQGRLLRTFLRGRVDKVCAVRMSAAGTDATTLVKAVLIADLVEPYAVFLR